MSANRQFKNTLSKDVDSLYKEMMSLIVINKTFAQQKLQLIDDQIDRQQRAKNCYDALKNEAEAGNVKAQLRLYQYEMERIRFNKEKVRSKKAKKQSRHNLLDTNEEKNSGPNKKVMNLNKIKSDGTKRQGIHPLHSIGEIIKGLKSITKKNADPEALIILGKAYLLRNHVMKPARKTGFGFSVAVGALFMGYGALVPVCSKYFSGTYPDRKKAIYCFVAAALLSKHDTSLRVRAIQALKNLKSLINEKYGSEKFFANERHRHKQKVNQAISKKIATYLDFLSPGILSIFSISSSKGTLKQTMENDKELVNTFIKLLPQETCYDLLDSKAYDVRIEQKEEKEESEHQGIDINIKR